jgi:hydrophobic/amphiphilic exporter-1 (mainly G- bacteria), HAE1 family
MLPGLSDVNSDLQISRPMLSVDIERDRASTLGITEDQIENALYDAYGQRQVSTIYTSIDEYWVILELKPEFQRDPRALGSLYIRSSTGQLVPLNEVAKLSSGVGPLTISHLGQLPAITLSFNLRSGVSLGDAVGSVQELA